MNFHTLNFVSKIDNMLHFNINVSSMEKYIPPPCVTHIKI
jgi:hypothetical protein